jgi:hypothetical protein
MVQAIPFPRPRSASGYRRSTSAPERLGEAKVMVVVSGMVVTWDEWWDP